MTKKKTQPKKKPATRKKVAAPKPRNNGGAMRFAMETCSISNPFCPEAVAARWPDNSHTKSVGWSLTGQPANLGTNAEGVGAQIYLPTAQRANGTVGAGTSIATFNTTMTNYELPSGVVRWRVTSYGLRINSPLAAMTATGTLHVRLVSPMVGTSLEVLDYTSIRTDAAIDVPISRLIGRDMFIVPKPLGDNARWFNANNPQSNTLVKDINNPGWQIVVLGVSGAPASASAVVRLQLYYNFEFVFEDGSASQAFAIAPPHDQPAVRQANSSVLETIGNFIEGTAEKIDSIFKSKAFQLGGRLALSAYTRNPTPMIMNVD